MEFYLREYNDNFLVERYMKKVINSFGVSMTKSKLNVAVEKRYLGNLSDVLRSVYQPDTVNGFDHMSSSYAMQFSFKRTHVVLCKYFQLFYAFF